MIMNYVNQWQNQAVIIIGGGVSAEATCRDHAARIKASRARVIVVNDAFLLYPEADALYFGDKGWWGWHHREINEKFKGSIYSKTAQGGARVTHLKQPPFEQVRNIKRIPEWSDNPCFLGGTDSGHQAINLAVHFGVAGIFLIGYDMKTMAGRANWHDRHRAAPAGDRDYQDDYLPGYQVVAEACKRRGVEVFNLNPDSALEAFPKLEIGDWLEG